MTDTPYFVIDDLTIGYHKVPVIRDISVKVQKGEIIALIGPNGAGKSTLLKTIARDLEPIRGKIFLEGRDMQTITYRELSKKLAVILTERIKVELTTCRDVVATGRYPYTGRLGVLRGEDQRIVDEAMETVHALELAERDAERDHQRENQHRVGDASAPERAVAEKKIMKPFHIKKCTDRLFRWSGLESLAGGAGVADGRACPDSGCEGTKLSGTCGCRIVRGALFY